MPADAAAAGAMDRAVEAAVQAKKARLERKMNQDAADSMGAQTSSLAAQVPSAVLTKKADDADDENYD